MNQERLLKILLAPHVSEKSTRIGEKNRQVVFKVTNDANKHEVKNAVEKLFNVEVIGVQITNVKSKAKRFSGMMGTRKGWKKAYITLAEGSDIQFASAQ
jgi:large subunit ribosomal protein L23